MTDFPWYPQIDGLTLDQLDRNTAAGVVVYRGEAEHYVCGCGHESAVERLATVPPTPLGEGEVRFVPGYGNHCPGCTALLNMEAFRV